MIKMFISIEPHIFYPYISLNDYQGLRSRNDVIKMNEIISKLGVITIVILAIYLIKKFDNYLFFARGAYHHSDFD